MGVRETEMIQLLRLSHAAAGAPTVHCTTMCSYHCVGLRTVYKLHLCRKNGVNVVFVPRLLPHYHVLLKTFETSTQRNYNMMLFSLLFSLPLSMRPSVYITVSLCPGLERRKRRRRRRKQLCRGRSQTFWVIMSWRGWKTRGKGAEMRW